MDRRKIGGFIIATAITAVAPAAEEPAESSTSAPETLEAIVITGSSIPTTPDAVAVPVFRKMESALLGSLRIRHELRVALQKRRIGDPLAEGAPDVDLHDGRRYHLVESPANAGRQR